MDLEERTIKELPQAYIQDKMYVSLNNVIISKDIKQWPYLNHIKLNDMKKDVKEVGSNPGGVLRFGLVGDVPLAPRNPYPG